VELNGRLLRVDQDNTKYALSGSSKNSRPFERSIVQPASQDTENAPINADPVPSEKRQFSPEDFWQAWNTHRDYLKRLSMIWMNVSAADAEDACSEATIRAYEKYEVHAHQICNERAWFARLLHNICIDRHRSNKRVKTLCERVREINSVDFSIFESRNLSPEGSLLNDELSGLLLSAIRELPDRLQKPVILRLVQGEDYDDIATALAITNDNARKRVQQGRSALRGKLFHLWSG
jgi:RNA polymerase sigma factor (sigma-70 family)